jgi:large subunit ribosomal protein L5
MARLLEQYRNEVIDAMVERFDYKNRLGVPRLEKIVVNMGVGNASDDKAAMEQAQQDLPLITGQAPVVTRARQSIAAFKVRAGNPVGLKVTLRRERMYEFLDRLISTAIPRVRDFRGLNAKSFDGRGNYSMGVNEQLIFPEIHGDDVEVIQGMDITICTTAETDEEAHELLRLLGMPFRTR